MVDPAEAVTDVVDKCQGRVGSVGRKTMNTTGHDNDPRRENKQRSNL